MKISVCMIVKDEEAVIARCLNCVKQFADEIIIVDTGSADKTKEIASKFTQNVYDFIWRDDFSKARNFAFSKATCDFVMWVDADDVVSAESIEKINTLKTVEKPSDVYMCKYVMFGKNSNEKQLTFYRERILRNNFGFFWVGFIHEAIVPHGKVEYSDIEIWHRKILDGNPKRNLMVYRKSKRSGAIFDARAQYYYSKELFYNGYYTTCIKELKRYLHMQNKFVPNIIDAYLTIARCYSIKKEYHNAKKILFAFLNQYSPNVEIVCELANQFFYEKNIESAIYFFESSLNLPKPRNNGEFVDENYYYIYQHLMLVSLYYQVGNYAKAKIYHDLTKMSNPQNEMVIYNERFFS